MLTKTHWVGKKSFFGDLVEKPEQTFWPTQNMHNLEKLRVVFDSANTLRTSSPGSSISGKGRAALGGEHGRWRVQEFCHKRQVERLLSLKENQVSQVREPLLSFVWEHGRVWLAGITPVTCTL